MVKFTSQNKKVKLWVAVFLIIPFILLVDLNRYFRPAVFIFLLAAVPAFADSHLGGCPGLTVQLRPDGTLWCAGLDNHGQLGNGAIGGSSSVPVQVVGLNAIKAISVGDNYVMALDASGKLWAWGANSALVLGPNATGDSGTPVQVAGLPPIRFVSAGHAHVLAIDQAGGVWTWGTASAGEMGSSTNATSTPVKITLPSPAKEVAAGYDFSLALLGTGGMMAWGNGANGALGGSLSSTSTPTAWPTSPAYNITHIVAFKQALGLQANGTVLAWGYGGAYGTGFGSSSNISAATVIPGMAHIKEIVGMGDNSGAIDSGGQLWLWGGNAGGSLGMGVAGPIQTPYASGITGMTSLGGASDHVIASGPSWGILGAGVNSSGQLALGSTLATAGWEQSFLTDTNGYSAVAAGNGFTLALYKDGSVHSVGRNDVGELGLGSTGNSTTTDAKITNLNKIISLAAGDRFALALRSDGAVFSWGNNDYGQLGNGNTVDSAIPVQIPGLTGISMIAAGADHAIAVTNAGVVFVWGRANHYQLGLGNLNEASSPTQLTGFTGTPIAISASGDHTLLLTTTGLYSFGSNGSGECGQGSSTDIQVPTLIAGLSNIAQIAAGRLHSLVLTSSGQILAFGDGSAGELADGTNANQTTPEAITLPSYFNAPPSSIAAGNCTSFVEDAWGNILGAGLNASGQLGSAGSSGANVTTFTSVGGVGMQIAPGYNHTVLVYPGYLSLAGDNSYGELNNGSTISAPYFSASGFQNPPTSNSYVGLASGLYHSLGIDEQGNLYGWGSGAYADLGDGGTTTRLSPTLTASGLNLIQVSAGYQYSMGIDAYGRLWGWGYSNLGAAGTGSNKGGKVPQLINFTGAVQVSCGYDHTLVLRDDGTVWGFGNNTDQCLSSAAGSSDQLTPIQIPGFSNITAVTAGQWFSMALGSNGLVYGLGTGTSGQLGRGWSNTGTVVTADTNLVGVLAVAAGSSSAHSLAVDAAGNCWATGAGQFGQNGSTSFSSIANPAKVATNGVTPLAGAYFSLFLMANGTTVGFGEDQDNQLNDNLYAKTATPKTLSYSSPLSLLTAGANFSLGILGSGASLVAYGDDTYGELGNGQAYPPPPLTPTNFTATLNTTTNTEIDLSWKTPTGSLVANYEIDESTNGGTSWTTINMASASATSYAATGLAPGTYTFRLLAINTGGVAQPMVSSPVQVPWLTPGAPTSFSAIANGSGEIDLSWVPADKNSAYYTITYSTDGGETWNTLATVTGTTYRDTGLQASENYQFKVFGVNGAQIAGALASTSVSTASVGSVSNLVASQSGSNINLAWSATDGAATTYSIMASANNGLWYQIGTTSSALPSVQYQATGLLPGTRYAFQVFAINGQGQSSAGVISNAITTPYTTPIALSNIQFAIDPSQNYTFTWTDPNGTNETTIGVETVNPDGTTTQVTTLPAGTTSYTVSGTSGVPPNAYQFVVLNTAGSASTVSIGNAPQFYPHYVRLDLGRFVPSSVTSAGTATGLDASGNLARWSLGTVTELTVNRAPFQPSVFSVNSSGAVVSTAPGGGYGPYAVPSMGVGWGPTQIDTTPLPGPSFTITDAWGQTGTITADLSYNAIDDAGNIYSTTTD